MLGAEVRTAKQTNLSFSLSLICFLIGGKLLYNVVLFSPVHAKSLQSCLTLCDPMDSSPSGSSVPGIL